MFEAMCGCTFDEFFAHIESKMVDGMTWDNYGLHGWHMDHIRPLASFDLSDESQVKLANHYTNVQPLWAKDNLSKGSTIPEGVELDCTILDVDKDDYDYTDHTDTTF